MAKRAAKWGKPSNHILLAFGIVASLCLSSCKNDYEKVKLVAQGNLTEASTARGVTIHYSDSGRVRARIKAPVVIRSENKKRPSTTMPKGMDAEFFNAAMDVTSTMRSNQAVRYENERLFEATGNVVVTNVNGDTLRTEKLVWNEAKATMSSDQAIRIRTKTEIITGDGFESNQDFTRYRILKPRGTIKLKQGL